MQSKRYFSAVLGFIVWGVGFASQHPEPICPHQATPEAIEALCHQAQQQALSTKGDRIAFFSTLFLEKPYTLTALGEGSQGDFDQAPLYRLDAFDCQTFVETVLALSAANSAVSFANYLRHIRYQSGHISFTQRFHFLSPDWNRNNQHRRLIEDITTHIKDQHHYPVFRYAHAHIDVPNWYRHFDMRKIRLCHASKQQAKQALKRLQDLGQRLSTTSSTIAYIPFSELFDTQGHPNAFIFQQIPNGAIIEIVRPNWDLTQMLGTHLNISHLGFAIRDHEELYYYQALASAGHVIKLRLVDYLDGIRHQSSIQGINIQRVLPSGNCFIILILVIISESFYVQRSKTSKLIRIATNSEFENVTKSDLILTLIRKDLEIKLFQDVSLLLDSKLKPLQDEIRDVQDEIRDVHDEIRSVTSYCQLLDSKLKPLQDEIRDGNNKTSADIKKLDTDLRAVDAKVIPLANTYSLLFGFAGALGTAIIMNLGKVDWSFLTKK